mmetsp:Transcript_49726/g.116134  ORF Transcript_49726/g.116134 Transcript_49726/m.116134 type:complete len:579 (+) Transcript_49726:65-1801(+)
MAPPLEPVRVMICVLLGSLHWYLTGESFCKLIGWMQDFFAKRGLGGHARTFAELRVEAALQKVSEENYVLTMSLVQHVALPCICGFIFVGDTITLIGIAPTYYMYMLFANNYIEVTPRRIQLSSTMVYCAMGVIAFTGWSANSYSLKAIHHGLIVCGRAWLATTYLNSQFHIGPQVCLTLWEFALFMLYEELGSLTTFFLLEQICVLSLVLAVAGMIQLQVSERLAAELKTTDAERMLLGFRRVLQGICDGDVLLDGSMKILQHRGLKQFVSKREVAGKPFQEMLVQEAEGLDRFKDFIATSTRAAEADSDKTPYCLRVSMAANSNSRVGMDVFHVALPNLYGSKETYHLLAMRQDSEPLAVQQTDEMAEMSEDTRHEMAPQILPDFGLLRIDSALTRENLLRRERRHGRPPSSAASVKSRTSAASAAHDVVVLPTFPHLEEIKFVFEPDALTQPLLQVHVKYFKRSRHASGSRMADEADLDRPTLRKFTRPTDWPNIEDFVQRYARTAAQQPTAPAERLDGVYIRRFDHTRKYMLARFAELSPYPNNRHKLWLHLKDFVHHDRLAPASELADISEQP